MSEIIDNTETILQDPGTEELPAEETQGEGYQRLEAELRAELEREIDRRVTQAVKKARKKFLAEQEASKVMDPDKLEEERQRQEALRAEMEEKEYSLKIRGLRLDVVDIVSYLDMPSGFRNLVAVDDLVEIDNDAVRRQTLIDRIKDLKKEFEKLVKKAVAEERAKYKIH